MNDEELIWESYKKHILKEDMEYEKELDPEIENLGKNKGYTIEAYHGSWETDLNEISNMRTSYGLFFSPDPITAGGYSGDKGKIYHVLLYAPSEEKILDVTDERTRFEFFTKHLGSNNLEWVSKQSNYYGEYDILQNPEKIIIKKAKEDDNLRKYLVDKFKLEDLEYLYDDMEYELESIEISEDPVLKKVLEQDYHLVDEQAQNMLNEYGSQNFYINKSQNEMLRTANRLGYTVVIFDDQATSSGGESISYVVFDPSHIKSADSETYDDNGNIISLENRFDINIDDIRY
jgi:hypothetical protein